MEYGSESSSWCPTRDDAVVSRGSNEPFVNPCLAGSQCAIDQLAEVVETTDFEELKGNASGMHKLVGSNIASHGTTLLARACNKGLRPGTIEE